MSGKNLASPQPNGDDGGKRPRNTRVGAGDEGGSNVIKFAEDESRRLGHNFVGTEQILIGIIRANDRIAARALKSAGVDLAQARTEVEKIVGRGQGLVAVEIPFTPRSKRVLELAWEESRQLGDHFISTEHLLLALLRERDGVAMKVLESLGVDSEELQQEILKRRSFDRDG